ncbi:uncharacterized protein I206_101192 [Kwoniella pini CBS 10737]|uniref:Succinate dehydrogenase assembly factor 2, mitochondrial n=1 Tax=Kwoniella pini CBS 10737 TaxID=1296096 RepID=A0A1B9IB05_9TREE|nr:succinate dehydrogenase assembly factor 2, mitochondrial [Kwoniella pini CBS 10737]OCF52835.1 succinate dehydrogenase assembly factor 2, mitochondrial [Kwoniella pini CBS 10737]
MSSIRILTRSFRSTNIPSTSYRSFSINYKLLKDSIDPFPLPFSNPELASNSSSRLPDDSEEWPIPSPLDRTGENLQTLRSRLIYQTRKRGTLETDLILSTFAKEFLPTMSYDEMKEFDKLLDEPDWDIFYWAVQKREPPPKWKDTSLLKKLIQHAKNEGKVVRRMPELMQKEPEL